MLKPKSGGLLALRKLAELVDKSTKDSNQSFSKDGGSAQVFLERQNAVKFVEASSALAGYAPITSEDGFAYELREMWLNGQIDTDEHINLLKKALLED